MDLLLDSHVFLWWDSGAAELAVDARRAIADASNRILVSAATVWEIAIKRALGKLDFEGALAVAIEANGFEALPILSGHAERAAGLPSHHRDPFDRMLIAQAVSEGCTLVTHDRSFVPYGIACLWT